MSGGGEKQFQLLIKPVGPRCNLACRYCFYSGPIESDRSLPAVMSDAVLETMLRKYLSLRLPQSVLCWQGGEPTLAGLDFFRRAIELQQRHGRPGQLVSNALQTNGQLIDDEWAEFLGRYRFLVGVSIDGPPEIHNAQRLDAAGRGSLQKALDAARLLDKHGVEYNILSVIHRGNQHRAEEIFGWQLEQGWKHLQYIPCVEFDDDGRPLDFSVTPEGYGQFMVDLWRAYRHTGRRDISLRTFDSWLSQKVIGQQTMCTFSPSCGNYLMVKPDGSLYPCDFFFDRKWRLGDVMEDELTDVMWSRRTEVFGRLKGTLPQECRQCEWLAMCNGGCPKDRRGTQMCSYLCAGYKHALAAIGKELDAFAAELRAERQAAGRQRLGGPQVGRNDKCPCGSGRKFKHCCGR